MKKILLDTNVILDIALDREKFVEDAVELLRRINKLNFSTFVTATTVTDIYYITKKQVGHGKTIRFLNNLFEYVKISGVDANVILNSLKSGIEDFEDAIQVETAKQNDIDIIITRNKKDFEDSGLQIYTPGEYIESLEVR